MSNDIEYQHTPEAMVVLISELKKMTDENEAVVFTPEMLKFILEQCEDATSVIESITEYLLAEGIVSHTMVNQWKQAYRNRK
jgi:hypothetical protein